MTVSLSDLIAQREAIERQINHARATKKSEAVAQVRTLMAEHGLSVADLVSKASGGIGGKKVAAKYRDPMSGATWSGRGLKPRWLSTALESGKSVADFTI